MGIGSKDGQHQLPVCGHRIDVLLLKVYADAHILQLSHGFKKGDRVAGESADRLGNDVV